MNPKEILEQARDSLTVRRVYGEPIRSDGLVVVPAALVIGGAGAGGGEGKKTDEAAPSTGAGGGWSGMSRPVGAFVISEGQVRWQPVIDVNRVILGGQLVAVVALLVLGSVLRRRRRRA
jgi:uncharacterized spore protein YtfJ